MFLFYLFISRSN